MRFWTRTRCGVLWLALALVGSAACAADAARGMARGIVSKFQPCLPEAAEDRLLAEKLLDLPGTLQFLGSFELGGVRATARPSSARLIDGEASKPLALELRLPEAPASAATPRNEIRWVDTPAGLRTVSAELQAAEVVALDVETALDFGTLLLVQIATRHRTYLIDPFAVGDLGPLAAVLDAPTPRKIIHNARFERRVLGRVGIPSFHPGQDARVPAQRGAPGCRPARHCGRPGSSPSSGWCESTHEEAHLLRTVSIESLTYR